MLKKAIFYTLFFILMTTCTSLVVVFLSSGGKSGVSTSTPSTSNKIVTPVTPVKEENNSISSLVSKIMGVENYSATYELVSEDKSIDISGNINVLNDGDLKLNVSISGSINSSKFSANIVFLEEIIYVEFLGAKIKIASSDIESAIVMLSEKMNLENSDFSLDSVLESVETMKTESISEGFKLSIELPYIGELYIFTDEEYLPVSVIVPNISFGENSFEFSLWGSENSARDINMSSLEKEEYTDLSYSKEIFEAAINSIDKLPMQINGTMMYQNEKIEVSAFIDKAFTIQASVKCNNLQVDFFMKKSKIYINLCGSKIVTSVSEISNIISKYPTIFGNTILSTLKFSDNRITIGNAQIDFGLTNGYITRVSIESGLMSGTLNCTQFPEFVLITPNYSSYITATELESVLKAYSVLLSKTKLSVNLTAGIGSISASMRCFANINDKTITGLYAGGTIGSMSASFAMKNANYYAKALGYSVKFTKDRIDSFVAYVMDIFSIEMIKTEDIIALLSNNISSISISASKEINIVFDNGMTISCSENNGVFALKLNNLSVEGKTINISIETLKNDQGHEYFYKNVLDYQYVDMSGYSDSISAVANTFLKESTSFKGRITVKLWDITLKNINVSLKTSFSNGEFGFTLELDNLPRMALITDIDSIGYGSHKVTVTYSSKNNYIYINRIATKSVSKKTVEKVSKNVALSDISFDTVMDIFGFDNTIRKKFSNMEIGDATSIFSLSGLSKVDSSLSMNLTTSSLHRKLSDAKVDIVYTDNIINQINMSLSYGKINISFSMNRE